MPWSFKILSIGVVLSVIPLARGEIPSSLEATYADAVLAYSSQDFNKALLILNDLIKQLPGNPDLLSLRALSLKAAKKLKDAADVYMDLIHIEGRQGVPESKLAPYYFDLGKIYFDQKTYSKARSYFEISLRNKTNSEASEYYLGVISYEEGNLRSAAQHFDQSVQGNSSGLEPATFFYLGQTHLQLNDPIKAIRYFHAAIRKAQELKLQELKFSSSEGDLKNLQAIIDESNQALRPYDHGDFFANLSLLAGYDSNLLLLPSSISSSDQTSGKASSQGIARLSVGYATSPIGEFQFTPSDLFVSNYNLNRDALTTEFASNTLSLYVTHTPYEKNAVGMKLEDNYILQNDLSQTSNRYQYLPYLNQYSIGPYYKTELNSRTTLLFEAYYQPLKDYLDPSYGNEQRSGPDYLFRASLQPQLPESIWNPGGTLTLEYDNTQGNEFRSKSALMCLTNSAHWKSGMAMAGSLGFGLSRYSDRPTAVRTDETFVLQLNLTQPIFLHLSVIGNLGLTENFSNVSDLYQYHRQVITTGLSYDL